MSANQPDKETPLALRLAAELDEEYMYFPDDNNKRIAAELRRLSALTDELVEALEFIVAHSLEGVDDRVGMLLAEIFKHRAEDALEQVKGESNAD